MVGILDVGPGLLPGRQGEGAKFSDCQTPARNQAFAPVKHDGVVRNYYILPCCLLLLNLCVELVSYKARMFADPLIRTGAIMGMVLVGGSFVGFVAAPAIGAMVGALLRHSRRKGGSLGEAGFLLGLGLLIFWLYYRVYILGPESILPAGWHNPGLIRK
jgi:hypothetical protein